MAQPEYLTDRTDIVRLYKFKILDWSIWVWFMLIPRYTHQAIDYFDLRINIRGGKPLRCLFITIRPRQYPEERLWSYVLEGGFPSPVKSEALKDN